MRNFCLKNEGKNIFTIVNKCCKKSPVVIMFHGFTGNHIEKNFLFARLSKMLENFGISSIRFDFIGSGNSDGIFEEVTLSSEISDAYVVANYAKLHFKNIGILGFSMGGIVALLTIKKIKPNALCLWAPNVRNRKIVSNENLLNISDQNYLNVGGLRTSKKLYEEKKLFSLKAFNEAKEYKGPTLIIHGTSDQVVPFVQSQILVKEFKDGKLIKIEGSNHTFDSPDWSETIIIETAKFFSDFLKV